MLPTQLIFSTLGVMLNVTMPEAVQTICFTVILVVLACATVGKAVKMCKREGKGGVKTKSEVFTQTSMY